MRCAGHAAHDFTPLAAALPALLCKHLPCSLTTPAAAAAAVKVVVVAIGLTRATPALCRAAILPGAPLLIAHLGGGYGSDLVLLCAWALGALITCAEHACGATNAKAPSQTAPDTDASMDTPSAGQRRQPSAGAQVVQVLHAQGAGHALLAAMHAGAHAADAAAAESAAVGAWALGCLVRGDPGAAHCTLHCERRCLQRISRYRSSGTR